jgi:hypothetical protein
MRTATPIGCSISQRRPPLNPLAFAHQWLNDPIRGHTIHVHLARPNHPVNVDQARIRTYRRQLLGIHLVPADEAR